METDSKNENYCEPYWPKMFWCKDFFTGPLPTMCFSVGGFAPLAINVPRNVEQFLQSELGEWKKPSERSALDVDLYTSNCIWLNRTLGLLKGT